MDQDTFLTIVEAYCNEFKISIEKNKLKSEALEWSITRGASQEECLAIYSRFGQQTKY